MIMDLMEEDGWIRKICIKKMKIKNARGSKEDMMHRVDSYKIDV
jgi:hypothetical protein